MNSRPMVDRGSIQGPSYEYEFVPNVGNGEANWGIYRVGDSPCLDQGSII